ncbi:MAG TPA: SRPBCC family protein [Longimicrobium sp.]|nr:SRPBCC family protein [Longimicrobium sp.]
MSVTATNRHGSAVVTLPSETEILVTRVFDAPAELVFRAWTTPALVKRWWGFETSEWVVCEVDLRVGGRWRWVIREKEFEVGFHGEYREIGRPHRLVWTEVYEGFPGGDENGALNTMTLEEAGGVTTMRVLTRHVLPEHRDAHLASGMESGMQVSFDRMEDLLRDEPAAA